MNVRKPKRLQIRRVKGWRMPEGAVHVGRPSRWGNPFLISGHLTREQAVENYRVALLTGRLPNTVEQVRRELGGRDLACWCSLVDEEGETVPCHADVLLEVANHPTDP